MSGTFDLQAGSHSPDQLFVTHFEATESISRPFAVEVSFFPRDGSHLDIQELLGQEASLRIPAPGGDRFFHGEIHAARSLGEHARWNRYQVRIGPKLQRLELSRGCRIFQEMTVVEVVKKVLGERSVDLRAALSASYPKLDYCVQYRESELAFISRLLERDGIFYFFEHSDSAHTLVLGDGPSALAPMEGGDALPFRPHLGPAMVADEEHVYELAEIHRLRSGAVKLKDFDPLRPALDVSGRHGDGGADILELYDYPAEVDAPAAAAATAQVRIQERSQGKLTLDGRTHCPRLRPGATFSVHDHPEDPFNRSLLVVEVRHLGQQREGLGTPESFFETYRNEVRCLPKETPFRPARRTPRPTIAGLQTAIVTGAAGEEIHPDEHARVKVQFHWDREGKKDDKSSCWIRVGHSWAGAGFGATYLPRIGQEVLVRFLEGNPDRPLIAGSVYNGEQPPAASLPGEKTQSALQSSSSPGNSGNNELRFEDAARDEWVYLHAQKDLLQETVNDKTQTVGQDESLEVKKDRSRQIDRHQTHEVVQNDLGRVDKNQTNTITKNRTTTIGVNDTERVMGNETVTVSGKHNVSAKQTATETVGLAKGVHVGAAAFTLVGAAHQLGVGLLRSEAVAGSKSETIAGSRDEKVDKNKSAKVVGDDSIETKESLSQATGKDANVTVEVKGNAELGVKEGISVMAKKVELKAESKLNLIVGGKLLVTVDSGGKVQVNASTITVEGN
ncbi:MAG TPA: type VI secretion system tip protein TssI/VgrG [Myxococcales bacterium]|nr:type VI secretion system tip protein TssI/VgrG [Myxococcales bacterium]